MLSVLTGYLVIQLAFVVWADCFQPGIYDPEFDGRIRLLNQRRAENPDKPVLLMMGSSRPVTLFRPERLPPMQTADGHEALVFNFSHTFAGPSYMYLSYRRLVDQGFAPRWVVLEIMPFVAFKQQKGVYTGSIVAREFKWLEGQHETDDLTVEYLKARALPWDRLRSPIMHRYFPALDVEPHNFLIWGDYDDLGGMKVGPEFVAIDPVGVAEQMRAAVAANGPAMSHFRPDPRGERSLRALFDLCRSHGTRVAILLCPESPAFRAQYAPIAYREIGQYYSELAAQQGAAFIDAREWLDEADFADGHHGVFSGQTKFTDRLANEFLRDWIGK